MSSYVFFNTLFSEKITVYSQFTVCLYGC